MAKKPKQQVKKPAAIVEDKFFIRMNSGNRFYYGDMSKNTFKLHDFAHNLSQIPRFLGAPDEHYSVAQHSCHVADYVAQHSTPFDAFAALLHDFHEAPSGDVVTPFKRFMLAHGFDYEQLVAEPIDEFVYTECGMPWPLPETTQKWIAIADFKLYQAEGKSLVRSFQPTAMYEAFPDYDHKVMPWTKKESYRQLIARFDRLLPLAVQGHVLR